MNPEAALVDWLNRDDHAPVAGWEAEPARADLGCDPDLLRRLSEVARPVGDTARRFVAGCPVIHHPHGRPIAAASGASWLVVRSGLPAGALEPATPIAAPLGSDWVELDPWALAAAFARAVDLLRGQVARAYERADAETRA